MSKQKVVYKYGTGHPVPLEAKYLCTQVETVSETKATKAAHGAVLDSETVTRNALVWHYYELELEKEKAQ